jgi:hypothetical protein
MQKKLAFQIFFFVEGFNESSLLLGLKIIIHKMDAAASVTQVGQTSLALRAIKL